MTGLPFLVISIGIHILTIFVLQKTSLLFSQPAKDPVEITVVEKNNRKLISTHSPKNPNTLNLRPQNPRFQGETDQVVKEETKAPNLNYLNAKSSSAQSGIKQNENKNEESENDPTAERLHHLGETLFTQVASDTSTLDFIKEGSVTSLNTERNVYYSFFNRIEQQFYGKWILNLHDYELRLTNDDIKRLGGQSWTTVLEVVLNSEGHYQKHIVHQSSGDLALDLAAINSFVQTAYFPNPPKGMIKDDGTVRLYYGLIVKTPPARRWAKDRS